MASGALPPAFPAVRIDGELYWDGGILSNTPTEAVFDDNPRKNSLIFAVHMWNPIGAEPTTIGRCSTATRTCSIPAGSQATSRASSRAHRLRHVINELAARSAGGRAQQRRRCASWPAMAARRGCTWCGCWRRSSIARTTPRTSISARPASRSAGRPATPHTQRGARARALGRRVRSARGRHPARAYGRDAGWRRSSAASPPFASSNCHRPCRIVAAVRSRKALQVVCRKRSGIGPRSGPR